MIDALEEAALSGKLFQPPSRPTSPVRSDDEEVNTDDELGSDISRPSSPQPNQAQTMPREGAQTGPKGVLADRSQSRREQESLAALQLDEIRRQQTAKSMTAMTVDEEVAEKRRIEREAEAREDDIARMKWRRERREELERQRREEGGEEGQDHRKGGLREVGGEQLVYAVERPGWVVVLVYEQDIPQCQPVLQSMLHLSQHLPPLQILRQPLLLLRARATSLQFSLLPSSAGSVDTLIDGPSSKPDPDVLPTLLAYKDGELEKTWVRVDWEVGEEGIEGLLRKEGILPPLDHVVFDEYNKLSMRDAGSDDDNDDE